MAYEIDVFTDDSSTLITQAHLHCGTAGANGPVVAFLFGLVEEGVAVDGNLASGVLTADDIVEGIDFGTDAACGLPITTVASLYNLILENKLYVNIHSVENPSGEVRAQVFLPPP
jgi:CHRD domain